MAYAIRATVSGFVRHDFKVLLVAETVDVKVGVQTEDASRRSLFSQGHERGIRQIHRSIPSYSLIQGLIEPYACHGQL